MKFPSAISIVLFTASLAGCPSRTREVERVPSDDATSTRAVRLLVIDDPRLAQEIERQWLARSEQPIEVVQADAADWELSGPASPFVADVVVYPSGLLGTLAARGQIVPLADDRTNDPRWQWDDVFDLIRLQEASWDRQAYAVPFGSPQLTLWYRRDVLEALGEPPPETWEDYQRLVERCGNRDRLGGVAPVDGAWSAASEPLGPGWASQMLLARAASYARHPSQFSTWFDRRTMRPLIDGPPFVRALDELAAAARSMPDDVVSSTPSQVRDEFLSGRCAMAVTWPTAARDDEANPAAPVTSIRVGFAPLPGGREVYNFRTDGWEPHRDAAIVRVPLLGVAGRLASLTRRGQGSGAAVTLLGWLGSPEVGDQLGPESPATTLFRRSQVPAAARWMNSGVGAEAVRAYGELVEGTQNGAIWLVSPRILGRARYLMALDEAVHRVLAGTADSRTALSTAVQQWDAITDDIGRDAQRDAYARSCGLEP